MVICNQETVGKAGLCHAEEVVSYLKGPAPSGDEDEPGAMQSRECQKRERCSRQYGWIIRRTTGHYKDVLIRGKYPDLALFYRNRGENHRLQPPVDKKYSSLGGLQPGFLLWWGQSKYKKGGESMTLAEKIIKLRKEQGWSQEELSVRLGVSRQAVSKWESMASLPDLDRILKMSELFGVSTDYLLKEEAPQEESCVKEEGEVGDGLRTVSLEEANQYLDTVRSTAPKIAGGVSLCILSPVPLILLSSAVEQKIILIRRPWRRLWDLPFDCDGCAAVAPVVANGWRLSRFEYLEKEPIETEYGVAGIAESKQREYEPTHKKLLVLGISLCIVSVLPLLMSLAAEHEFLTDCAIACIFPLVALGVNLLVRAGSIWESYQKLLEEEDYTREKKAEEKRNEPFVVLYWSLVLTVYLGLSFITMRWDSTWIVWPVAAVFFGAALALKTLLGRKGNRTA